MNTIEEFVVILGLSFDIFAVMECYGSVIAKIQKKKLAAACSLLMLGQAAALGIGESISLRLFQNSAKTSEAFLGQAVAAAIFLYLGARLLGKAWRNERILEHREDKPNLAKIAGSYARTVLFTLLAGLAFGLLQSSLAALLIMAIIFSAIGMVLGIYTGYRLGFEHKIKAYLAGGILLVAGGIDVIATHCL